MIVNVSTTKKTQSASHPRRTNADQLSTIEDAIGSRLLDRIAQGGARSRPAGIRRERRGYLAALQSKRA